MASEPTADGARVLLLPSTSRDSHAMCDVLTRAGIQGTICLSMVMLCKELDVGAGAIVVAEEALVGDPEELATCIQKQPVWSDIPVVVLSQSGKESAALPALLARMGNVSILERPVRMTTLVSVIRSALRGRQRQYEVREHLAAQREAEAALVESETKFKRLANTIPQLAWMANPDGYIFWYNDRWFEYTGTTPPQMEGWGWQSVHRADTLPKVVERWQSSIDTGLPFDMEFPLKGADGVFRSFLTRVVPMRDADGGVALWFGTNTNVDEQRCTLELLRAAEASNAKNLAHLEAVVGGMVDGLVTADPNGHVWDWNPAALEMHGLAYPQDGRKSLAELEQMFELREFDGSLLPPAKWPIARTLAGEVFTGLEYVVRRIDRTFERAISYSGTPVRDAAGTVLLAVLTLHDVTERKRNETEREQLLAREQAARGEAERAGRMKDEFLATLSHELRTPLNAILGWAQILKVNPSDVADVSEGISIIERNARAQNQIIEDLLDMSRIISGKIRLDVQRVDLGSVVQTAVETLRLAADAKGVRLCAVLDPLAGPVSGDPNRLQQAFWNLLTNAMKFTPKGGNVQVVLERVNSHLEVSVIDTGEGIDPAFLPFVFDRFRQADATTTRRHGGLGLGLAIVKQLIELHGGSVRVKSGGLGTGSTFTVSVPLTVLHPESEAAVAERRHPQAGAAPVFGDACLQIEGVKVLVVDDEADARKLVKRLLEDCKAIVTTAASANEALEQLTIERPDVLVSDIGMPGTDGYALIRRVRELSAEQGGDIPAIALTAYARPEDRMKAVVAGFQHHVVKPVEPVELITLIATLTCFRRK